MNSHDRQHESLDDDERGLARIVRALPGGDPPPALDARILRMAQDAVAAAPTRRRRPLLALGSAWGISSAAAAVLALGVGWQLLNPPGRGLPASDGASAPLAAEASKEQRTEVDFVQRELPATPPPPPTEQGLAAMPKSTVPNLVAAPAPARKAMADAAAPVAMQEPFMDEHVDMGHQGFAAEAARSRDEAADSQQVEKRETGNLGQVARQDAPRQQAFGAAAPAPAAAPAMAIGGEALAQPAASTSDIDRVDVTGSRIARPESRARTLAITSSPADRERVLRSGDDALSRAAWIERIRQRMGDGDMAGAHASLMLHLDRHPGIEALPADVRRLLQK